MGSCRGGLYERPGVVQTEPVPASSKMDPLQDRAEAASDAGGASVTMCLKEGEKYCLSSQPFSAGSKRKDGRT